MGDNEKWVWFTEDDPISDLIGRSLDTVSEHDLKVEEAPPAAPKKAGSAGLVTAIKLHLEGKTEEALQELERAAAAGEAPADVYSAMGNLHFGLGRFEKAGDCYREILVNEASHKTANYNLAVCLEKIEDRARAAEYFQRSLDADPDRREARLGLGLCLLHLGRPEEALKAFDGYLAKGADFSGEFGRAVALHLSGKIEEAGAAYRNLIEGRPDSSEVLANLLSLESARQNQAGVRETATKLLAQQSDNRAALEALANLAMEGGDFAAAAEHCSRLVQVAPDSFEAWFNLGVACFETGQKDKALAAYQQAGELRPSADKAFANIGVILQENGDLAGAQKAYQRALSISSDLPGPLWNLALAFERKGDFEEAQQYYERLASSHPEWEDVWFRVGYLCLQRLNYNGAVTAFEECVRRRPDWADAHLNLGIAFWKLGDKDKSRLSFELALGANPKSLDALRALAAMAVEREDLERAFDLHTRLIEMGEKSPELLYNTGLLLQKSGMFEDAVKYYQQALGERPNIAEALLNMGHALKSLGRESEARNCWKQALEVNPDLASSYFSSRQ